MGGIVSQRCLSCPIVPSKSLGVVVPVSSVDVIIFFQAMNLLVGNVTVRQCMSSFLRHHCFPPHHFWQYTALLSIVLP